MFLYAWRKHTNSSARVRGRDPGPHLEQPQDRESIWSVRRQTRELYFVVFIGLFLAGTGLASLRAFHDGGTLLDTTLAVWSDAAPLTIVAAAAALALTEIGRSLMVLVRRLEESLERGSRTAPG